MPNEPVPARCVDLVKTYRTPTGAVHALRGVTLSFAPGALTAVVGPSGSGKSSLLRVLTGIDRATSGDVWVGPRNVGADVGARPPTASGETSSATCSSALGQLPAEPHDRRAPPPRRRGRIRRRPRDTDILERLGIGHRIDHLPDELSGGEQQRAAFAQAVVAGSAVVVADEPTAELDTESGRS